MFSSRTNLLKLKTNLRLALNRLKLLEKKKSELAQKSRKEIADYIAQGKYERAKIRVEHIIREDYMVEALELIEIYCDLLLSRFGLIQQTKGRDPSLEEAISSLIWVAPRIQSDVEELKVISDQFLMIYGKKYVEECRSEAVESISEKLKHKIGVHPPPKILIEKYLIEIAKNYNIPYEPDPQVMKEAEQNKGIDHLLFDGIPNNLDADQIVRPPGFIGYPQPPVPPEYKAFNYPLQKTNDSVNTVSNISVSDDIPSTCPLPPASQNDNPPPYYNIPPEKKPSNLIEQTHNNPKPNNTSNIIKPQKSIIKPSNNINAPELPNVPTDSPAGPFNSSTINLEEIDFDDLTRRFEELKKKK